MTGFPTHRFNEFSMSKFTEEEQNALFENIMDNLSLGYTVICSTPGKDVHDTSVNNTKVLNEYKSMGLATGYAYTVLEARHFAETNIRLVKLRNASNKGLQ
uniref:Calpain catalytic domain-containing protein n=1 Tax=Lygus hesperus TaxID=30085 RepID=A0A146MB79_LYGHE